MADTEPDHVRLRWAENLVAQMQVCCVTPKELRHRLAGRGVDVSRQSIGHWMRGEWSPRPQHQLAIAQALEVPARILFPIEAA